jgi:hypothetical protein
MVQEPLTVFAEAEDVIVHAVSEGAATVTITNRLHNDARGSFSKLIKHAHKIVDFIYFFFL